ncbi:MAG TPA: FtsX-like permease family protein [Solirubrobacteraceae bacterium]|jgi:putative ABC transport system permease protein|nr:FtsX-like permease family protein [Solirubrobacteraceae bacterium]
MIKVALKGLAGRKVRALLTAFAVIIGVSMVSGTFVLTDTMQKSFDGIFETSYENTDVIVSGHQVVDTETADVPTISSSVLEDVRGLPEVGAAAGSIQDDVTAQVVGSDGESLAGQNPTFASAFDYHHPELSPFKLESGDWARGSGTVVIDAGTASKHDYAIGDKIGVSANGPVEQYTITGIAKFGEVDSLGGAVMAVFDVPTAQALLQQEGQYDQISVTAKDGTSPEQLRGAVAKAAGANVDVKLAADEAADAAKETNEGLSFVRIFLLGFGGIALFVGAFVIFNTLSITVAQRTREFATLRTLGASRRQVLRSVQVEGLVIGLLASLVGLILGIGIAKGMNALFVAFGIDLPSAGTVVSARTIIVSLLLGTVITLLSTVVPARRATRVPPIAAVREGSELPASRMQQHSTKVALGVIGASIAAMSAGVFANGLAGGAVALLLGGGVLSLFVGVALLAPRLVKPLAQLVGWPARRTGGSAGRLASSNSVRNPSRTAATAAALMVGLTLVTAVAVLGNGLRASVNDAAAKQLQNSDYVLAGKDGETFAAKADDTLAQVEGVSGTTGVRSGEALIDGNEGMIAGVDPATIGHFYKFEWTDGSADTLKELRGEGAIVSEAYADKEELKVGSKLAITTPSGDEHALVVRGIYNPPRIDSLLGDVVMGQRAFDAAYEAPRNLLTLVDTEPGADPAAIEEAATGFPSAELSTEAKFGKDRTKSFATFLSMIYVLLAFSVVVSLFGMVNTLVLSVFERTRELGMLRAIGMTRRQARRMIRQESVITALIGAALGLPLGVFLAALLTEALSDYGVVMSIPIGMLAAFTVVALLAGIGAAILPARRASRLNVLNALHYE